MGALTPVFLFLLFLSANSDECSSCFSAIPISNSAAALYVFGDSTVDAGNNNYIDKAPRANYLPYGIDFNNTPTGRFTNGKTIADFIAILYNLSLPPSYLSLTEAQRKTARDGINYASAGCGIFPNTKPPGDEYPDATLTLANSHDLLQDILANTEKYGFIDVKDPCCGTYVNGELACIPNSTPCDNRCQ